jgi:DNA repair exonuclease SbcCD ATPase subunit
MLKIKELEGDIKRLEELIGKTSSTLEEIEKRIREAENKTKKLEKLKKILKMIEEIRSAYKDIIPALRQTYTEGLKYSVQSVIDSLTISAGRSLEVEIDDEYTPILREEEGFKRSSTIISGGERTWLSLAYKIGLGQLIFESRTGRSLDLLILDEPTEALGTEDGSINALASALMNLKLIKQIIAVTHSEELAALAANRILVEKQKGISSIKSL